MHTSTVPIGASVGFHRAKWWLRSRGIFALGAALLGSVVQGAPRNVPGDVSKIRGFNYESAPTIGHNEMWLQYDPAETERDMDNAKRLSLNQVRVFLGNTAYQKDKETFCKNLVHFVRACQQRGIGVMATLQYSRDWSANEALWPLVKEYAADLVNSIGNGKELGLTFWGVHNEPGGEIDDAWMLSNRHVICTKQTDCYKVTP